MANYNYLTLVGVCFFCLGLFVVIRGLFGVRDKFILTINSAKINYKNEFPIMPRNQRDLTMISRGKQHSIVPSTPSQSDDSAEEKEMEQSIQVVNQVEDEQQVSPELEIQIEPKEDEVAVKNTESTSGIFNIDIPPMGHSDRFHGEASMIDECLRHQDQEMNEDNQVLFNQKQTLTIIISPRSGELISGAKIIAIAREYGMKYGVLNMFHRYEHPEGVGMLWFSMLGVSVDGIKGFDLLDLPQMTYRGLVLFLALPHPQAVRGFDSMVQVAKTIAIEMDADIHDESDYIIDDKKFAQMRHYAAEYKG